MANRFASSKRSRRIFSSSSSRASARAPGSRGFLHHRKAERGPTIGTDRRLADGHRTEGIDAWLQRGVGGISRQQLPILKILPCDARVLDDLAHVRLAEDAAVGEVRAAGPDRLGCARADPDHELVVADRGFRGSAQNAQVCDLCGGRGVVVGRPGKFRVTMIIDRPQVDASVDCRLERREERGIVKLVGADPERIARPARGHEFHHPLA
jgi:hypothetical protein